MKISFIISFFSLSRTEVTATRSSFERPIRNEGLLSMESNRRMKEVETVSSQSGENDTFKKLNSTTMTDHTVPDLTARTDDEVCFITLHTSMTRDSFV